MKLTQPEQKIRSLLIRTAQGRVRTHKPGVISYKELWERVSKEKWGRGRRSQIVSWITRISAFDLAHARPPLNEIVVTKGGEVPGEEWHGIKSYLKDTFAVRAPYRSHEEAQEACWHYWGKRDKNRVRSDRAEEEVEEGYKQDRTTRFRRRNRAIIAKRKERDNYTCQACNFRLKINGKFVIDCHHTNPLGLVDAVTVTRLEHLICLCPTCHRIAHTRRYPLSVEEIRAASS